METEPLAQPISVVGLGHMGSKIGRLLLTDGRVVTVWNRTADKAKPLAELGASIAPSEEAAISASPISIICVARYDQVRAILERAHAAGALEGRSIVNLTWGTVEDARATSEWVQARGASYLDGQIMSYPFELGTPDAIIVCAGDRSLYASFDAFLGPVARSRFVSDDVALANVLGTAAGVVFYHTAIAAFLEAAAYARHYDVDVEALLDLNDDMLRLVGRWSRFYAEQFERGEYETDQATNRIHYDAGRIAQADLERIGQRATLIRTFSDMVEPLVVGGAADLSLACLYQVMRGESEVVDER